MQFVVDNRCLKEAAFRNYYEQGCGVCGVRCVVETVFFSCIISPMTMLGCLAESSLGKELFLFL